LSLTATLQKDSLKTISVLQREPRVEMVIETVLSCRDELMNVFVQKMCL
jgi:hypothetical protein